MSFLTDEEKEYLLRVGRANRNKDPYANYNTDPQQAEGDSSFFDAIKRGGVSGGLGVLQGQAQLGNIFGIGDGATAQALEGVMQENNRKKSYTIGEMLPFASDYWSNPEGATYDVANMLGSSAVLGGEAAAVVGTAGAAGIGGAGAAGILGRMTGVLSKAATARGWTQTAKILDSKLGQAYVLNVLKTPMEVASEGGNAGAEVLANGGSLSDARSSALIDMAIQAPLLGLSNTVESMNLGKAFTEFGGKHKFMQAVGGLTREALQNGWEEGMQQTAGEYSQGKTDKLTNVVNPFTWSDEALQQAAAGAVGGLAIGGGNIGARAVFGNKETEQSDTETPKIDTETPQNSGSAMQERSNPLAEAFGVNLNQAMAQDYAGNNEYDEQLIANNKRIAEEKKYQKLSDILSSGYDEIADIANTDDKAENKLPALVEEQQQQREIPLLGEDDTTALEESIVNRYKDNPVAFDGDVKDFVGMMQEAVSAGRMTQESFDYNRAKLAKIYNNVRNKLNTGTIYQDGTAKPATRLLGEGQRYIGNYSADKLKTVASKTDAELADLAQMVKKYDNKDQLKQAVIAEAKKRGIKLGGNFSASEFANIVPSQMNFPAMQETPKDVHYQYPSTTHNTGDLEQRLAEKYKSNPKGFDDAYSKAMNMLYDSYDFGDITENEARSRLAEMSQVYNNVRGKLGQQIIYADNKYNIASEVEKARRNIRQGKVKGSPFLLTGKNKFRKPSDKVRASLFYIAREKAERERSELIARSYEIAKKEVEEEKAAFEELIGDAVEDVMQTAPNRPIGYLQEQIKQIKEDRKSLLQPFAEDLNGRAKQGTFLYTTFDEGWTSHPVEVMKRGTNNEPWYINWYNRYNGSRRWSMAAAYELAEEVFRGDDSIGTFLIPHFYHSDIDAYVKEGYTREEATAKYKEDIAELDAISEANGELLDSLDTQTKVYEETLNRFREDPNYGYNYLKEHQKDNNQNTELEQAEQPQGTDSNEKESEVNEEENNTDIPVLEQDSIDEIADIANTGTEESESEGSETSGEDTESNGAIDDNTAESNPIEDIANTKDNRNDSPTEQSKEQTQATTPNQEKEPSETQLGVGESENKGYTIQRNTEKNGIEITFDSKPSEETLAPIKAAGFKWNKYKKVWWASMNPNGKNYNNILAVLKELGYDEANNINTEETAQAEEEDHTKLTKEEQEIVDAKRLTAQVGLELLQNSGYEVITDADEFKLEYGRSFGEEAADSVIQQQIITYKEGDRPADLTPTEKIILGKKMFTVAFEGEHPKGYVPKKVGRAYKLMEQWPDGTLHALFAGVDKERKMGEWDYAAGFTPEEQHDDMGKKLAPRYGWHMGTGVPASYHLMGVGKVLDPKMGYYSKKSAGHEKGSKRVWVEVLYDASNDYTDIAMQNPSKKEKDIRGLVPFGGYYMFQEGNLSNWIIASAIKFNKVLTNEERNEILEKAGYNEELVWRKQVLGSKLKSQLTNVNGKLKGEKPYAKNDTTEKLLAKKEKLEKIDADNKERIKQLNNGKNWAYKKRTPEELAREREIIRKEVFDNPEAVQTMTTANGQVYGFVKGDKVYIDTELVKNNDFVAQAAETPIHEYTHLWDRVLQQANPKLWERGVELMKQTSLWEAVKSNPAYANIANDENMLASEVHAMLTGENGANRLAELAKVHKDSKSLLMEIKLWLIKFWHAIRDVFVDNWNDEELKRVSIEDFKNMPLSSMVDKVNLKQTYARATALKNVHKDLKQSLDYMLGWHQVHVNSKADNTEYFKFLVTPINKAYNEFLNNKTEENQKEVITQFNKILDKLRATYNNTHRIADGRVLDILDNYKNLGREINNDMTEMRESAKPADEKPTENTHDDLKGKNKQIHDFALTFGLDEDKLKDLVNRKPTESNINEFGRFDALKATVDKAKAKEYFEKLEGKEIIPPRVNMKIDKFLREFVLNNNFDLATEENTSEAVLDSMHNDIRYQAKEMLDFYNEYLAEDENEANRELFYKRLKKWNEYYTDFLNDMSINNTELAYDGFENILESLQKKYHRKYPASGTSDELESIAIEAEAFKAKIEKQSGKFDDNVVEDNNNEEVLSQPQNDDTVADNTEADTAEDTTDGFKTYDIPKAKVTQKFLNTEVTVDGDTITLETPTPSGKVRKAEISITDLEKKAAEGDNIANSIEDVVIDASIESVENFLEDNEEARRTFEDDGGYDGYTYRKMQADTVSAVGMALEKAGIKLKDKDEYQQWLNDTEKGGTDHVDNSRGLRDVSGGKSPTGVSRTGKGRGTGNVLQKESGKGKRVLLGNVRPMEGQQSDTSEHSVSAESAVGESSNGVGEGIDQRDVVQLTPAQQADAKPSEHAGHDFTITKDVEGGDETKFKNNIAAIKLVKQLQAEGREATPKEQAILAKYVGWGGLSNAFNDRNVDPKWAKKYDELKALLDNGTISKTEYGDARTSTLTAFYTPIPVVKSIWSAVKKLGFKGVRGERVLEPATGTGNFIGAMPVDMRSNVTLHGVEKETISGEIAKQLYQSMYEQITPYEKSQLIDDFYDLVITNVPFATVHPVDKKYDKYDFNLHDYYINKMIDQAREGGLIVAITSTSTMDSTGSGVLRNLVAEKADLITAIRLPNTTFRHVAGTNVASDLLIFKKRKDGEPMSEDTKLFASELKQVRAVDDMYTLAKMNAYYVEHPDMLIGEPTRDNFRHGVIWEGKGLDIEKELKQRLKKLPKNIYEHVAPKHNTTVQSTLAAFAPPTGKRINELFVKDGKVYIVKPGNKAELISTKKAVQERALNYVDMRDTVLKLYTDQINPEIADEELTKTRKKAMALYRQFVGTVDEEGKIVKENYGWLHDKYNCQVLGEDPQFGQMLAIEAKTVTEKGEAVYVPADILSTRTVNVIKEITTADNSSDALAQSLNKRGEVNLAYMAELTGKDENTILDDLRGIVYQNPQTQLYETAEEYLSGNVREKLEIAELAAHTNANYKQNVEALKKVQPVDLTPNEISVQLGSSWVPASDIESFVAHLNETGYSPLKITHSSDGAWSVDLEGNRFSSTTVSEKRWGTYKRPLNKIIEACLQQKLITIKDSNNVVDEKETIAARQKQAEVEAEFEKWIWADSKRAERLANFYNRIFNSDVLRSFNGSHLKLDGISANIELKDHQKDAVWRILTTPTTLLAHCVGAGKTWTMQAAAMEGKRLGLFHKPMFVVPKNIVMQFDKEFRSLYPNAKLLTINADKFPGTKIEGKDRQKKLNLRTEVLSRIATEDWDGIILSYQTFQKLPVSPAREAKFMEDEIARFESAKRKAAAESNSRLTVKNLEKAIETRRKKLEKVLAKKDNDIVIPFEQLGVDQLFVDEADNFKNMAHASAALKQVKGINNSTSDRAVDMLMKTQTLLERYHRGIVFATGTPISNTMDEMYTMLRYLAPDELKRRNLNSIDEWFGTFGRKETIWERSSTGDRYVPVERVTGYKNQPEMIKLFRIPTDVKRQSELKLDVPAIKGGKPTVVEIPMNPALEHYIKVDILDRAKAIKGMKSGKGEDNFLKITTDLRKASLDMRLIDPSLPAMEVDGKLRAVVENTARIYKETEKQKSTQLIFCDIGVGKQTTGDLKKQTKKTDGNEDSEYVPENEDNVSAYSAIFNFLVQKGVSADEIAFMADAKNDDERQALYDAVNEGKIRIVIGSTEKMGAGTNFQKKLIALHHVTAPWRPRDIEQREGRIIRQGNENKEVEIFTYVVKDSYDANSWEKLKQKQHMIDQAMSGNLASRDLDDISESEISFAEVEALASGNPLMAELTTATADLNKYDMLESEHYSELKSIKRKIEEAPAEIAREKAKYKELLADQKARQNVAGDKFTMKIGGKIYTERTKASEQLEKVFQNYTNRIGGVIGEIAGFKINAKYLKKGDKYISAAGFEHEWFDKEDTVMVTLENNHRYVAEQSLRSIEYAITKGLDRDVEYAKENIERLEKNLDDLKVEYEKPFQYKEEQDRLLARVEEIKIELNVGYHLETQKDGSQSYVNDNTGQVGKTISADGKTITTFNPVTGEVKTREVEVPVTPEENSINQNVDVVRSKQELSEEIKKAFTGADIADYGDMLGITLPNGRRIAVGIKDQILLSDKQSERASKAHNVANARQAEGSWQFNKQGAESVLNVSRHSRVGTAFHEAMHVARDIALSDQENQALDKYYAKKAEASGRDIEEEIAEGYREWALNRSHVFGKLWRKIKKFLADTLGIFKQSAEVDRIMEKVASGEAWKQDNSRDGSIERYSIADKAKAFFNVGKEETEKHRVASAITSRAKEKSYDNFREWADTKKREMYTNWFDKNDALHDIDTAFEKKTGEKLADKDKIYSRAASAANNARGMAGALIEGSAEDIKQISAIQNIKLNPVSLKMVVETADNKDTRAKYAGWLKDNGLKSLTEGLGTYLGAKRLLEMADMAGDDYVLPKVGDKYLTKEELKAYIQTAPQEFAKASEMYYKYNDNMLLLLQKGGLLSEEAVRGCKKYRNYCPLMRDFSDTASANAYVEQLSNGGRGIGNVSNPLQRIGLEGSGRKVFNPLESTMKATAIYLNRIERNKVAQQAVLMAEEAGLEDIAQHVESGRKAVADSKNCIFTVMFDGEKYAYKTTPDLYDPIVGYNLPAANFVLQTARMSAKVLRTGATMSPAFIVRNLLRDTVTAGVASRNGFIPIIDTIRGARALLNDKKFKAKYDAMGISLNTFYGSAEQIADGIDKMAGSEYKWNTPLNIIKSCVKALEKGSEFVENATRAGEFKLALDAGKSIYEAAEDAREVTLNFSRSGVTGEKINQYIPFFNACLQGGDKLYRLFRDDPHHTSVMMAKYILLPSMALWLYNTYGPPDDRKRYEKLDLVTKNTNWILPGGIRIPKPQETGVIFGSGLEALLDVASRKDPVRFGEWAKTALEQFTPNFIPTIISPLIEWQSNYSFFKGKNIAGNRLLKLPDELQYYDGTSELAKGIGHITKLSPVKIDNTVRGYTGTMGMLLVQAMDLPLGKTGNGPAKKWNEQFFFRDFNVTDYNMTRYENDFYELLDKANKEHSGYGKKGNPDAKTRSIRAAGTLISDLRKDIQTISNRKNLNAEQKRILIDKRKEKINKIAEKAVKNFSKYY